MSKYKVGDIVLYRNTRENISKAEITSFEHQYKIGDHIDYRIGEEWKHDYATIHAFDKHTNLPIAETNSPGHDGCKWSYTFDLSKIRLTQ